MSQTAQIHNLGLVREASERLRSRPASLPGIAALYGPAGWGKTTAAIAIANENRSYFVRMGSTWRAKALLENVLRSMGIKPTGTIPAMLDMVCEQLGKSGRMLMIDEADYAVAQHSLVELLRDIYEGSQGTLFIIGEEMLPRNLEKWERFHSRVLTWIPAQPVSLVDARMLAPIYCPDVRVADDLLEHLVALAKGSVRRVSVNLAQIGEVAAIEGWDVADRRAWGDRPVYTGQAPKRGM